MHCEAEQWPLPRLNVRPDGSGRQDGPGPRIDLPFFSRYFIGLGRDATVLRPSALVEQKVAGRCPSLRAGTD